MLWVVWCAFWLADSIVNRWYVSVVFFAIYLGIHWTELLVAMRQRRPPFWQTNRKLGLILFVGVILPLLVLSFITVK